MKPRSLRDLPTMFSPCFQNQDSLAEWSKAPDSSSGGAIRVGSNPTAVTLPVSMQQAKQFLFMRMQTRLLPGPCQITEGQLGKKCPYPFPKH